MIGLGTIVNVSAIVFGGLIGLVFRKAIKERCQETIIKTLGFACMMMALGTVMAKMLVVTDTGIQTKGVMMMVISLALGAFFGEIIDLDSKFETFGAWLKVKSGNQGDTRFIDAFVTASLTVCVGAMAIIGSIQDGIEGDHNTLFTKAILDFIIIIMMTASMGKGCIFSAISVGVFQGFFTVCARLIAPIMTTAALDNISLVGNVLILCVGVNLVWPKTIRVANVLPALVFAVIAAFIPWF